MSQPTLFARLQRHLPTSPGVGAGQVSGLGAALLGPGLWLMRRVRARAKVSLLLAVFAIPLTLLTVRELAGEYRQLNRIDRTIQGLATAQAIGELGLTVFERRRALLDDKPAVVTAEQIAQRLAQAEAEVGRLASAGLTVPESWGQLVAAVQPLTVPGAKARPADEAQAWLDVLVRHVQARADVLKSSGVLSINDPEGPQLAVLSQMDVPDAGFELAQARSAVRALAAARAEEHKDDAKVAHAGAALAMRMGRVELVMSRVTGTLQSQPLGGELRSLSKVQPAVSSMRALFLSAQGQFDLGEVLGRVDSALTELVALRRLADTAFGDELQRSRADALRQTVLLVGVMGVTLLISCYLAWCYVLATLRGFDRVQAHLTSMAEGDFSTQVRVNGSDEVADALQAINRSFTSVGELLSLVQQSVGAIHHAGAQMANGNAELTERNRRATQGLQDVVDGVARYATQLEACGKQVESVVGTVQELRMGAARSRKQMQRLQERMHELRGKSREISQIVGLIDNIAFRTNILALNASIEASKAGEAGRGFAVVAQEVRSLAQRSAESSRRIGDIILRSSEDIELSSALADETGRTLTDSDRHVDRIHAAIDDVAGLTRGGEQQSATILGEVRRLNEDTQRNTTLVEQLATAGERLESQGQVLVQRVDRFKLG